MISRRSLRAIKPVYATYNLYKYVLYRFNLAVATLGDWRDRQNGASMPLPPARLRHRVHGSLDKESFLETGKIVAQNVRDLCVMGGRELYAFEHVLDFGCGCGRVLRNFQDAPASCNLYGTDIDSELIDWCKSNLKDMCWSTNGFQPPLPFENDTFDLIYSISVFTHLDEEFQHAWLRELQRVARPGATLILSVHGESTVGVLDPLVQQEVKEKGFLYITGAQGKLKLDGLPDFYQTTFHTPDYVKRTWSNYFDIVRYIERGINSHQDVVILRKG